MKKKDLKKIKLIFDFDKNNLNNIINNNIGKIVFN